jgi:hypothetical protein
MNDQEKWDFINIAIRESDNPDTVIDHLAIVCSGVQEILRLALNSGVANGTEPLFILFANYVNNAFDLVNDYDLEQLSKNLGATDE